MAGDGASGAWPGYYQRCFELVRLASAHLREHPNSAEPKPKRIIRFRSDILRSLR
jgi:hypothetical protein